MNGAVDYLIVGGGVAGLSAAWRLAAHGRVVVLEREDVTGYHSSGRSVTYYHFGIGNLAVRLLTHAGGIFFSEPPPGFTESPLARPAPAMMVVREGQDALFEKNLAEMAAVTGSAREIDPTEISRRVPVLKLKPHHEGGITRALIDPAAARLDGHALMMGYRRGLHAREGTVVTGAEAKKVSRCAGRWHVETPKGIFSAPVLINAAGAWADEVAQLAGVTPIGLQPTRRTIISFDPPEGVDIHGWPLVRSLADEFYFLPETGRVLASPADQTPCLPCDVQPDEFDVALAAWRIEEVTTMQVRRVIHRWAGLRTFAPDRVPVAGFDRHAPDFFWLAGQGGYGLQTAPAMALACESIIVGTPWPSTIKVTPEELSPGRITQGLPSP